jgi:hypothetical protein
VDREHLLPGEAAQVEAVLFGGQLEFAAEGGESYVSVWDDRLVLEDDIDLLEVAAEGWKCCSAKPVYDCRHLLGLGIQTFWEDDAGRIRIYLLPFQGGGITAELLGEQACRYAEQKGT